MTALRHAAKHACSPFSRTIAVLALVTSAFMTSASAATAASEEPRPGVPIRTAPCDKRECHQFDFWIGDWNVFNAKGELAGTNKVERILGGCVIQENWSGTRGSEGKSFNMYSPADSMWHQTWVDNEGSRLDLEGGFEDGRMVLAGDSRTPNGGSIHNRITWEKLADGRVQQHWEVSPDGEKWSDAFLGFYTPRQKLAKGSNGR